MRYFYIIGEDHDIILEVCHFDTMLAYLERQVNKPDPFFWSSYHIAGGYAIACLLDCMQAYCLTLAQS